MSSIDEVMKGFNKKFKEDLVHTGLAKYEYDRIPFTSLSLNYMTFGGLPVGKLIEFSGENHSGKTTSCMDVAANYQKLYDRKVLWVDCENTFDAVWANKIHLDVDNMILMQPTNQGAETIFQFILDMIDTNEVGLVILDSIGVMVSNQAMDKTIEEKTYGGIAMALTQFSNKAVGLCHRNDCTFIATNQMRDDLNSAWGGTKTVGGRAWQHNVSVRIEFRQGKYVDDKGNELSKNAENPLGNIVDAKMIKNKTCPPTRRMGSYRLNYLNGIDYMSDLLDMAKLFEIVEQAGAWYTIVDIETGEILVDKTQGLSNLTQILNDNKDITDRVAELVTNKINVS